VSKAVRQTVKTFKRLRKAKEKMDKRQGKNNDKTVPEAAEIPKQRVLYHKDQIIRRSFNEFRIVPLSP
jgi:hypothetical protein